MIPFRGRGPLAPPPERTSVMSVRIRHSLRIWLDVEARRHGTNRNQLVSQWIIEQRALGYAWLPDDVIEWLKAQAARNNRPGDLDTALIKIIRALMEEHPHGIRLWE